MKIFCLLLLFTTQIFALTTQCNKVDPTKISDQFTATNLIYSGYLNVAAGSESALAFLFYGQQTVTSVDKLKNYPTLIWLNGLLGESSQIGNFLEIGPLRFNSGSVLEKNAYTWNQDFNILFVDLVVGTGYSSHDQNSDIPANADQLVEQFLFAVDQFITSDNGCVKGKAFAGLDQSNWYIFGEGYAAKQIVNIASRALDLQSSSLHTTLKGIGLGNAHIDPVSLLSEIPAYAFNLGLIEPRERSELEKLAIKGVKQIQAKQFLAAHQTIQTAIGLLHQYSGGINIQNIDQLADNEEWMSKLVVYLKDPQTIANYQFDKITTFKQSSSEIIAALSADFPTITTLPKLKNLQTKLKILVYTGQNDVQCPIPSTLRYLSQINDDFKTKSFEIQKVNDKIVGYRLKSGDLLYVSINNAGFQVPLDKGAEILSIVQEWLK